MNDYQMEWLSNNELQEEQKLIKLLKKKEWDKYFMSMTFLVASKSCDPSTKIGAVIVGKDHEVISTGYNGLPRGVEPEPRYFEKPLKYSVMEHAERNSIYNVALMGGCSTKGTTMYTNGTPCWNCGRAIIQAGIKRVVVCGMWERSDSGNASRAKWKEEALITKELFQKAGVELDIYDGPYITNIQAQWAGEKHDLK